MKKAVADVEGVDRSHLRRQICRPSNTAFLTPIRQNRVVLAFLEMSFSAIEIGSFVEIDHRENFASQILQQIFDDWQPIMIRNRASVQTLVVAGGSPSVSDFEKRWSGWVHWLKDGSIMPC